MRTRFFVLAASMTLALTAGELPLLFERHASESFRVRGNGYSVLLDPAGMHLTTAQGTNRLRWLGAGAGAMRPLEPQAARVNYLVGSDRAAWRTDLPTFSRLRVDGLYEGASLFYYGTGRELEYDLVLRPGVEPDAIRFRVDAVLDPSGELRLANGMRWKRPVAKQDGREIAAAFQETEPGVFGFSIGPYDRARMLTIDPVLTYATYLGGALADEAKGIAADAQGNSYIVGSTRSTDFPGINRGQTLGGQDAFVAKLNDSGRAVVWATYFGGSGVDTGNAIAVDSAGAVYITGETASTNLPVSANAPQRILAGGSGVTDAFITKLSADGASLIYCTYLGGSQSDAGNAIALDRNLAAYVAGRADSTDFPSTTRETLPPRGAGDAFIVKLSPDGSGFVYATYLGGFALDSAYGVAVDAQGSAYATGETRSENFPVSDPAFQGERRGNADAFLTKLSPEGNRIVYSTYYGGEAQELARAVALDNQGNAYVAGVSNSSSLPVSFNAAQRTSTLPPDAFVAKFDALGTSLLYGTYLGGSAGDEARAIAVDPAGNAYVAGQTTSTDFPTLNDGPLTARGPAGGSDGFLTRVSSGGNVFQFSGYFGGAGTDSVLGIAIDGRGRTWITGVTDSADLPATAGVLATKSAGATEAFAALLSEITVAVTPGTAMLGPRETQQFTAAVSNTLNTAVRWSIFPESGTISSTGLYTAPDAFDTAPVVTVSAISLADGTKIGQATITLVNRITVTVSPAEVSLRPGQTQQFSATVAGTMNTGVTWSAMPAIGTISASGLFTAPASILSATPVTVRATSVADSGRTATATVTLLPALAPSNPGITAGGVTNAASFRASTAEGGIAAGEIITLFGTDLGPASAVTLQLDGRGFVANRLAGTRVLFDGTPGAMIATSAGQVSVVAPYEVEGKPAVTIRVEFEGRLSEPISLPVTDAAPGIFTLNASGMGSGSVIRQNGEIVTAGNGAEAGEALSLFATGEGATDPSGVDGKPTVAPLPRPKLPVRVVIDGAEYEPLYAGGAPGLVAGVLQVNFAMPALPPGSKQIRLRIGDKLSPERVTIQMR